MATTIYVVGATYWSDWEPGTNVQAEILSEETYDFEVCARSTPEAAVDAAIDFLENYRPEKDDGHGAGDHDPVKTAYVAKVVLDGQVPRRGAQAVRVYVGSNTDEAGRQEIRRRVMEGLS